MSSYAVRLAWSGDTATGYAAYERNHVVAMPPAEGFLDLSADAAFRGDASLPNPEALLLAAVSSCQLLSFLAVAARTKVRVTAYEDSATAVLDVAHSPARMGQITLRPHVTVAAGTDVHQVDDLMHQAHEECYIANSLAVPVAVMASIRTGEPDQP
jgi:organic hydroperoxide reductase OsmC/OhrA